MWRILRDLLRTNRAFAAGVVLLGIVVTVALLSFVSPYPPNDAYVVPPDVPPERLAALRQAFMATLRDPATLDDARRLRLQIDPTSGAEVQALIAKVFATPPRIVERLKRAIATVP